MDAEYHKTAGGVVVDEGGRVLVLERDVPRNGATVHEVRLPKGHIEDGETVEAAAMREVGEESGYWMVEILADLGVKRSTFEFRGKRHERDERYFLMRTEAASRGETRFDAGSEEALFTCAWLAADTAEARLTYESERAFVAEARRFLKTT